MDSDWQGLVRYGAEQILVGVLLLAILLVYRKFSEQKTDREDVREYILMIGAFVVVSILGRALWIIAHMIWKFLHI